VRFIAPGFMRQSTSPLYLAIPVGKRAKGNRIEGGGPTSPRPPAGEGPGVRDSGQYIPLKVSDDEPAVSHRDCMGEGIEGEGKPPRSFNHVP